MITKKDLTTTKKAIKKVGVVDYSKAHRIAMENLSMADPKANKDYIQDLAWELVKAVKCGY